LLLGTLSDVGVGEGAQRHDPAVRCSQVGEDPCHETIGHALAAVSRVGLDVGHHDGAVTFVVVGDRHDVAVDNKFVPLPFGVVSYGVLHIGSVARKGARSATSTP